MQISATVTILVLVASATFGWHQRSALNQLHAAEQALLAKTMNLTGDAKSDGDSRASRPRKSRADREAEAKTAAAKLIASLQEVGKQAPGESYLEVEKRTKNVLDQMVHMNDLQLRVMIEELRNCPQLEALQLHQKSIGAAIDVLADTDPQAAMTLLTEKGGQLNNLMYSGYDRVIGRWAATDPLAALAWMRGNRAKINKHKGAKAFVIGHAAKDPKLAVQAMVEFGTYELHGDGEYEGNPNFAVAAQIARTARTLHDRTAMLGILRVLADSPGDDPDNVKGLIVENALRVMAEGLSTYGFARASTWLESSNLRPGEVSQLLAGLQVSEAPTKDEAGKWFEWMGEHLSPGDFGSAAHQKIHEWVTEDPQAVAKWLAQAADGPAKRTAEAAYASSVTSHQPKPGRSSEPSSESEPVAATVEGRPGFVTSPFNGNIVDVRGVASGTLVADPTFPLSEKKYFRIP